MLINNEILNDFIVCHFKAYRKSKHQTGIISDYQSLYNQLKQKGIENFERTITRNNDITAYHQNCDNNAPKEGISLNFKFANANIDITLDGIEFTGKKNITPIYITPFEKVTPTDKLFLSLQATYIHNEFNLQIENCKIVYGTNSRQTKFKLSSFTKSIKKQTGELSKILSNSNAPAFFKNYHCQICEFQSNCLEKLIERDDLSLLTALKPKEIVQKNNRGIFSVKQLSYTFRPKKNPYRRRKFLPELKALAIREGKTFIQEIPTLNQVETEVYLDFEGIVDRGSNYLIGAILKTNEVVTEHSFWANNEEEEKDIFIELIHLLKPLNSFTIYHFGSYEIQSLKRISQKLTTEQQEFLKTMIDRSFNVLNFFSEYIYPPTYSNSLKEIARFLKFEWTEKDASGLQSTVWRYNWEISLNNDLKQKLIQYNIEDCRALKVVKDWLDGIDNSEGLTQQTSSLKSENIFKWGITNYIVKDFEEINSKAYFDYQREHIYLRTEKKVFRAIKRQESNSKLYNIPDKRINLFPEDCPNCKSTSFKRIRYSKKLQIDLIFMKQGIKKHATLYTGGAIVCNNCKKMIETQNMRKTPQYGDNLMLWTVNQKIQYRQSTDQIINLLKDSFKIQVSTTQLTHFKEIIAHKYVSAYKEIIVRINNSKLIHVDETIARIKQIDGYVWVFVNYECVYYEFRETREPDFLKERLSEFKGVLISDFYTGYDGLDCEQQKCLVHLIRDLNEVFLKNQLDLELKKIVIEFGILLRKIITTIDKFGLKRFHLNKHKKDVDRFYLKVISIKFESELALSFQKRFVKYKEKLFLFLEKDNIPWNNNNAEHSIKPFAKWRKKISKSLTKQNIENHLILLSILQTCKYQGINFFEFLKSGELSIFEFQERRK
jgi:predicted RecB family nuclease